MRSAAVTAPRSMPRPLPPPRCIAGRSIKTSTEALQAGISAARGNLTTISPAETRGQIPDELPQDPAGSRRPGGTAPVNAAGSAPGSHRQWTAQPPRPAWSARREYGDNPTAGSRAPGGRPAGRCSEPSPGGQAGVVCWRAASRRCQDSSVAGVTGKTSAQRRRGMNRVSTANQARPPGSYRTRPTFRRSTAFSCRSTSSSASLAWSPRNTRTARPNNQRISKQTSLSNTPSVNHHSTKTGSSTTRSSFRAAQVSRPRRGSRVSGSRLPWAAARGAAGWCSPMCGRPAAGARRARSPGSP